jgi:ferric-dicitrate binding protein FerR (iron transport regulator)
MSQLWIGVAWGLWLGTTPAPQRAPRPAGPARRAWASGLAVLLLGGQAVAVVPAWREWGHLDALLRTALSEQTGTRMQPRFWSHGRLLPDTGEDRAAP